MIARPEFKRAWELMLRQCHRYATTTAASKSNTIPSEFLEAFILSMDARRMFATGKRGATAGELMSLAMQRGIFSSRTVTQIVQRLEDEGKIERVSIE